MEATILNEIDTKRLQNFINQKLEGSVKESLLQYIRIPNVTKSYYSEADWNLDTEKGGYNLIKRAGAHIAKWVTQLQIQGATVNLLEHNDKTITPIILTEIASSGVGTSNDSYFFYGHYDKQPPMDKGWVHGKPYEPQVIMNGNETYQIYGRGGADDGYSTYSTMVAIKALQDQGIPLPKIVMITEGDEQSGSGDVEHWLQQLTPRFGTPKLIFCLDSGTLDYDRFWLTNSLRGYLVISLHVKVLETAIHSGSGTGIVPTCFRIVRQLLQRIQSAATGVMAPLDLQEIPPERDQQIIDLVDKLGLNAITKYPTVPGLQTPSPDIAETIRLNTWKAQVQTLAIEGYPQLQNSSNIVAPQMMMKISIRLPPTKDHLQARETAVRLLTQNPPYNALVQIIGDPASDNGFDSPPNPIKLKDVFQSSSQQVFGDKYLSMGQGGSIPFMNQLKKKWNKANFIITGLLGPDSNAHGPNECLRFDYLKKLTASFAHIIAKSIPIYFPEEGQRYGHHGHHTHEHHGHHHGGHHGHSHDKKYDKSKHGHGTARYHLQ